MQVAVIVMALLLAAHPSVEKARRAYEQLRFEDVLKEVSQARKSGKLSRADDLELTRLEAFTYAVYDDAGRAVDAFGRLLAIEPTWAPPSDTSPKIRRYFEEAKAKRRPVDGVSGAKPGGADPTPPFYASGWFWGALGVALAAGLGAGFLLTSDDPGTPRGNLGTLELP